MNKTELIAKVAQESGASKVTTEKVINAVLDVITDELQNDRTVTFTGFGTFLARERKARSGRNPRTGEQITIPSQKTPAFKAGKNLKAVVK